MVFKACSQNIAPAQPGSARKLQRPRLVALRYSGWLWNQRLPRSPKLLALNLRVGLSWFSGQAQDTANVQHDGVGLSNQRARGVQNFAKALNSSDARKAPKLISFCEEEGAEAGVLKLA